MQMASLEAARLVLLDPSRGRTDGAHEFFGGLQPAAALAANGKMLLHGPQLGRAQFSQRVHFQQIVFRMLERGFIHEKRIGANKMFLTEMMRDWRRLRNLG